jgi:hypothetical protein
MADFSDNEDRLLVQLAQQQQVQGKTRLSWALIAKQMPSTHKTPEQLRLRLVHLKKRFGNDLARFPRWYFVQRAKRSVCRRREQHRNAKPTDGGQTTSIDSGLCEGLIKLFEDEGDDDDDDDGADALAAQLTLVDGGQTTSIVSGLCEGLIKLFEDEGDDDDDDDGPDALAAQLTLVDAVPRELAAADDRVRKLRRRPKERMSLEHRGCVTEPSRCVGPRLM